jgi:hypothetical protein
MSSLFDGLINDGVFASIGTSFVVTPGDNGMAINVGIGRAWFDHTWTYNDAIYPVSVTTSELTLDRIDAVVIEVDSSARTNAIKMVKGTPSGSPLKPTMVSTSTVHQHPLAYVYVGKGVTGILAKNITNVVGTSECPYVTGIIDKITIDGVTNLLTAEFEEWFATIQGKLSGDVAGQLQNEIDATNDSLATTNTNITALSTKVDSFSGGIGKVKNINSGLSDFDHLGLIFQTEALSNTDANYALATWGSGTKISPDGTKVVFVPSSSSTTINLVNYNSETAAILSTAYASTTISKIIVDDDYVLALSGSGSVDVFTLTSTKITFLKTISGFTWSTSDVNFHIQRPTSDSKYIIFNQVDSTSNQNRYFCFDKSSQTCSQILSENYNNYKSSNPIQYNDKLYEIYRYLDSGTYQIRTIDHNGTIGYAFGGYQFSGLSITSHIVIDPIKKEMYAYFTNGSGSYYFHRFNLQADTFISKTLANISNGVYLSQLCFFKGLFVVYSNYYYPYPVDYLTGRIDADLTKNRKQIAQSGNFVAGSPSALTSYNTGISFCCWTPGIIGNIAFKIDGNVSITNIYWGRLISVGGVDL